LRRRVFRLVAFAIALVARVSASSANMVSFDYQTIVGFVIPRLVTLLLDKVQHVVSHSSRKEFKVFHAVDLREGLLEDLVIPDVAVLVPQQIHILVRKIELEVFSFARPRLIRNRFDCWELFLLLGLFGNQYPISRIGSLDDDLLIFAIRRGLRRRCNVIVVILDVLRGGMNK